MTNNERLGNTELPKRNMMQRALARLGLGKSIDETPVETVDKPTDIGTRLADAGVSPRQFVSIIRPRDAKPEYPPPVVVTDPAECITRYNGDYSTFYYGERIVTVFLREGESLKKPPEEELRLKRFDGVVEDAHYITQATIMGVLGRDDAFQCMSDVIDEFRNAGLEPHSADAYQELFRRGLSEPNLELVHVVTGVEAGYSNTHFGFRVPESDRA